MRRHPVKLHLLLSGPSALKKKAGSGRGKDETIELMANLLAMLHERMEVRLGWGWTDSDGDA